MTDATQVPLVADHTPRAIERDSSPLARAFELLPQATLVLDSRGVILHANASARRLLGNDLGVLDARFAGSMPARRPDGSRYLWAELPSSRALLVGEVVRGERMLIRRTSSTDEVALLVDATPLGESGTPGGALIVLQPAPAEPAAADASTMPEGDRRQSDKLEVLGRLVGGIAHDFNNVLHVILSNGELLLEGPELPPKSRRRAEQIVDATRRAASFTAQLLAFTRKRPVAPRVLDLNEAVTDLSRLLRRMIGEDVELVTHLDGRPCPITADPGQLSQVLMNLAVNARDAMPAGGTLTIETSLLTLRPERGEWRSRDGSPGWVMLAVSDTGHGIDAETLPRIFEPFFTTKDGGRGTGFGLATVRSIVQQWGGRIEVVSEAGQGATFRIFVPAATAPVRPGPADRDVTPRPAGGTETVLVVEDEPLVRNMIATVLRLGGYTVLEAGDAAEGQRLSDDYAGPIPLLIVDAVLPDASGQALAERIAPARPGTKVLFVSGYSEEELERRGVSAERAAFLQKPFAPAVLMRAVRALIDATV